MKNNTIFLLGTLVCAITLFSFCTREANDELLLSAESSLNAVENNDRGGIPQIDCSQKTVYYEDLASLGIVSTAFSKGWVQELDRIANNCRPQSSCTNFSSSGTGYACCTSDLNILDILQTGGYGQQWPYVTPAEQNYIIDYTLNYVTNELEECSPGVKPVILAVDYMRDPFITITLTVVVKWACCSGSDPN